MDTYTVNNSLLSHIVGNNPFPSHGVKIVPNLRDTKKKKATTILFRYFSSLKTTSHQ